MAGLRKLRRARKFKYDRNRRRVKKSQESNKKDNVRVGHATLKAAWDGNKAVKQNLADMGLAFDANQIQKVQGGARALVEKRKRAAKGARGEEDEEEEAQEAGPSSEVVQKLEEEVRSFQAKQTFRFPDEDVRFLTLMLDRHGDDFKAMARDPKNLFQLTPKQLRQKIVKFMSIPEQFAPVAKERGLLDLADKMAEEGGE